MTINEAMEEVERQLGRSVTVRYAKKMPEDTLAMITHDVTEVNPSWAIKTSRLSVFREGVMLGQFVLYTHKEYS